MEKEISEYLSADKRPSDRRPNNNDGVDGHKEDREAAKRLLADLNELIRAMPVQTPSSFRQSLITIRELGYALLKLNLNNSA